MDDIVKSLITLPHPTRPVGEKLKAWALRRTGWILPAALEVFSMRLPGEARVAATSIALLAVVMEILTIAAAKGFNFSFSVTIFLLLVIYYGMGIAYHLVLKYSDGYYYESQW